MGGFTGGNGRNCSDAARVRRALRCRVSANRGETAASFHFRLAQLQPNSAMPSDFSSLPSTAPRASSHITVPGNEGVKVVCSCTIRRPAAELYAFWRRLENLPQIIKHPVEITELSATRSRWTVTSPGDRHVSWDALIINDHPGELIAWRSEDGSEIPHAGSVRFEPAANGDGTEVTVALEYDPPGGKFVAWLAKLTGEAPEQQVRETLKRLKLLTETGAVPARG